MLYCMHKHELALCCSIPYNTVTRTTTCSGFQIRSGKPEPEVRLPAGHHDAGPHHRNHQGPRPHGVPR
eukprot:217906-Hanusia_phi.AAC.1